MNKKRITLQKMIWSKVRCWQMMNDISDKHLANAFMVTERTLRNYDKDASDISLKRIDNFLNLYNLKITDILLS